MRITHPHVASLIFQRPLMIHRPKLDVIIAAIKPRIGMGGTMAVMPMDAVETPSMNVEDGIAVIPVFGSLVKRTSGMDAASGLTSYTDLQEEIMDTATDPAISGILLDIDSCGGECSGAFDLSDLIFRVRQLKPIYAVANDDALSAGYLIASSAERIFMTQTALVGSIGVIAVFCDQSQADIDEGLDYEVITYGDHKADFNSHAPLSAAARAWLLGDVNRMGDMFVSAVARNRNMVFGEVRGTQAGLYAPAANGKTVSAIDAGLADEIGTRADALSALQERIAGRRRVTSMARQRIAATKPPDTGITAHFEGGILVSVSEAPPASVSAAAIPKEAPKMADVNVADANIPTPPEPAPSPAPTPSPKPTPPHSAVQLPATGMTQDEMENLNDLCLIAGNPAAISGFIKNKVTFQQAKAELMKARVDAAGPEIQSQVLPDAGTKAAPEHNFLKDACTKRALASQKAVK